MCNPVKTPMVPGLQLIKNNVGDLPNLPYQSLVGVLMYLVVATRPDISHSVSFLSQYKNCYDKSHWEAAKAENVALTDAAKEAMHLKQLIPDMGTPHQAIELFNDNISAQTLSKNPSPRSKHINIKEHFIRENVQNGGIVVHHKSSEDMEADIFTKGLAGPRNDYL
ncbi:hypothetical protein JTB14_024854 [Gonioctena quinquepunctata]|nr:hypothetical protein JTB14_024854 [Gonioctena quinquepunctata]